MTRPRGGRRRWPFAAAAALVALAGGLWWEAGRSDPVPVASVVDRAREGTPGGAGPLPGVYTYAVDGSEQGGAGPLSVRRRLPGTAPLLVTRTADGWLAEMSFSRQHIEATRNRVTPDGVVTVWRRVDVTFAGFGRDDRRDIDGRLLVVPADAAPGDRWTDVYRTGTLRNRVQGRVLRREVVRVAGVALPVLVISSRTRTTGALSGRRDETLWWSPRLMLPVRSDLEVSIDGVFGYSSRSSSRLTATEPIAPPTGGPAAG